MTGAAQEGYGVEEGLDWERFAAESWDRRPVLVRGAGEPFAEHEVFAAAVAVSTRRGPDAMPAFTQFTVDRDQRAEPAGLLPAAADGSFDGYERRMREALHGRRYALVAQRFHELHPPQWARERDFYAGLWERVGQPLQGAITALFHGSYEHSPAGVHRDRYATFMFVLRGRKRMRFWAERPWPQSVTTMLDYGAHLDSSFAVEAGPGDLLYWPSRFYHVGENCGDGSAATSVNVGVPCEGRLAAAEIPRLWEDAFRPVPGPHPAAAQDGPAGGLPYVAERQLARVRAAVSPEQLAARITERSLSHWTVGGFPPAPPPAPRPPLPDGAAARATTRVLWAQGAGRCLVAANGHVTATDLPPDQLSALLTALNAGGPVPVDGLPEPARALLSALVSFHAAEAGQGLPDVGSGG
ncbi:JmjC domain-containing protein [Streptomyces sp. NPDC020983]|uniref:JmjC domain-containing protein n=1 Tax=Streptomyces sp. NPDC020983 TaxID=3365106 RepID=UPI0037BD5ECB